VGVFEDDNEPFGTREGGECLNQASDYQLLKNDLASWSYLVNYY
jgi:hypothetical protein